MTAADYPSLDTLLTTVTPATLVKVKPFDLDHELNVVQRILGEGQWAQDRHHSRGRIFHHVTALAEQRDDARRWVDRLQGECAALTDDVKIRNAEITRQHAQILALDAAAHEALRWLDMAATYATSEDVAAAIDDAAAALRAVTT